MPLPTIPNFDPASNGRITTSRDDFETHVSGAGLTHAAGNITLSPPVLIAGHNRSTVAAAITALAPFAVTPTVAGATSGARGVVKLSGDISGTADTVVVSGLQGEHVSSNPPVVGDVLTFSTNGLTTFWAPATSPSPVFAGDLSGSNTSQNVIAISGDAVFNINTVRAEALRFVRTVTPSIKQTDGLGDGATMTITSQSTTGAANQSGDLLLNTGDFLSGGSAGSVTLGLGNVLPHGKRTVLSATDTSNGIVLSLFKQATTIDMPVDTGSGVVFIKDTATPPDTGNPVGGSILYSENGQLKVKQSDGTFVVLGETPNPTISGVAGQQRKTLRFFDAMTTTVSLSSVAHAVPVPTNSFVHLKVTIVAKEVGSFSGATYTYEAAFARATGSISIIGSVTPTTHAFGNALSLPWTAPTITAPSTVIYVTISSQGTSGVTVNYLTYIETLTCGA
jgi:hypothetical protein